MDGWLGVELRHLAALAAVDEERSFRGAAERLGYVQSAVSQQISQLERLVGTRLVDRARGHAPPVTLTPAGTLLLEHGNRILAQLEAARADLRGIGEPQRQVLRVGVMQSVAAKLLPIALIELRRSDPTFSARVEEVPSDRRLFGRVADGLLDVAFAELPLEPGPFEYREVLVDPLVLLVAAGSRRATMGPPTRLAELAEIPLVRVHGWQMMDQIEQLLLSHGLKPEFGLQADANSTVQALVAAGLAGAIVPTTSVQSGDPRVVALPLGDLVPPRRVSVYWHAERRNRDLLETFLTAAERAGEQLSASPPEPQG